MKYLFCLVMLGSIAFPLNAQVKENERYIDSVSSKIVDLQEFPVKIQEDYHAIISTGEAGNIGIFVSENGVLLIDDQWSTMSKRISEYLSAITQRPVKAIINTHYHYDHTNGNLVFGAEKVPIISHCNARQRMSEKQVLLATLDFQGPVGIVQKPYPSEALPILTFTEKATIYMGNEIIELIYFKNAHSDGDIVVHFKKADIYHTGDIFVTYGLPYIDEAVGGNIYDMIEAVDELISQSSDKTKFIPGHGPLCSIKELTEYRNLLAAIRDNVEAQYRENKKLDEIIKDTKIRIHYEDKGGDKFIEQVYRSVKKHLADEKV